VVILIFLYNFTSFGFQWKMLRSGQKIAVDIGVNEKLNAIICYVIAGVLLGIAAVMYLSKFGTVSPEIGLSSSSYFMSAFLPLFIGGAIEKYSDKNIGVLIGALTQAIITSGFGKLGFSSSLQTVLNGVIVMAFLVYTSNSYKLELHKMYKEKLGRALAATK
jgi:ribose transport system permease protein